MTTLTTEVLGAVRLIFALFINQKKMQQELRVETLQMQNAEQIK